MKLGEARWNRCQEVELLDEVDDDDAPADIPSFEDLLEKEAEGCRRMSKHVEGIEFWTVS